MLLQVFAIAYATEQKVLGKDGTTDKLATDEVESQTNIGYEGQGGWTPYQNGRVWSRESMPSSDGAN